MDAAIYFPIHRAKKGEIVATGHLSPHARARVRPIFDVQKQNVKDGRKIEEYFNDLAEDIVQSWGTRHALLIDFSRYEPDAVVRDGRHCIEYLFSYFRQRSMQGIPVAGPESVRGPGPAYLEAVARLAR